MQEEAKFGLCKKPTKNEKKKKFPNGSTFGERSGIRIRMKDPSPGGKKRPKNASLQSLMGVQKLKLEFYLSFVIYEQIRLLKVSYEGGDLD